MTISYTLNRPAANNNPSTDQPDMENNNDNVAAIIAVDHCGFNVSSPEISGQHLKVTFPAGQADPSLTQVQTQIYPKLFGSSTMYLETYEAAQLSNTTQINGYCPFVKCIGRFTGSSGPYPATLTVPVNTITANIASIVQTTVTRPGDTVTVTFTTALPYTNYYVFEENAPNVVYSVTKNLTSVVFKTAGLGAGFSGITFGFMVI
jgi:hypothetical protein